MYEQDEPVLRRVLLIILWIIIIVTIAWAVVWLIFFRHHQHSNTPIGQTHAQTHSSGGAAGQSIRASNSPNTPSPGVNSGPGSSSSAASNTSAATQPRRDLANAGAGNIFVPFAVASVTGAAYYYLRLHRKAVR